MHTNILSKMTLPEVTNSFLIVVCVQTTIDVNLPQLQYIADHLLPSECRKLVAALHDKSYEITLDVNATEQEIPFDQSCVKLLLHWNSQPGEGRGENHEILCRRLEQLGKSKLATWLSRTVYHQLSGELKESLLGDPFKELATNATANVTDYPDMILQEAKLDTYTGTTLDIFFYIIIFILAFLLISLIAAAIWRGKSKAISKENNYVTRTFVPNPLKTNGNYIPLQDDTDFEN